MYKTFFGFKEKPFQLVPNPAYLFLSRGHEEALAHLSYAISTGEGFMAITGEVGTGKTTLCRTFLDGLDKNTEAAFIFNPKLNSVQLLKAVNDEFGINSKPNNTKDLIDALNEFLIQKKALGKQVLLLIDEAQNLNTNVLEQIRLLSNLETSTSKLLQIILVGQPELGQVLDSHELRQLRQRISLSWHLTPMTRKETREYIRHRIHIASQKPDIYFTPAAHRHIYRYSRGIPRLINIVCDRAFLTAYSRNRHKITGRIAHIAVQELTGKKPAAPSDSWWRDKKKRMLAGALSILFAGIAALCFTDFFDPADRPETIKHPIAGTTPAVEKAPPEPAPEPSVKAAPKIVTPRVSGQTAPPRVAQPVRPPLDFPDLLKNLTPRSSRQGALTAALGLWQTEVEKVPDTGQDDPLFFQNGCRQNGLLVHHTRGDLDLLKKLNLPAILIFHPPGDTGPRYLTLIRLEGQKAKLGPGPGGAEFWVPLSKMKTYWSKDVYLPWKNFLPLNGFIPVDNTEEAVIALKSLMQDLGFKGIPINTFYDEHTRKAIQRVQKKYGLRPDGFVDPLTKIVLYNERFSNRIPHISGETDNPGAKKKGARP